jgi:hypothetical protein
LDGGGLMSAESYWIARFDAATARADRAQAEVERLTGPAAPGCPPMCPAQVVAGQVAAVRARLADREGAGCTYIRIADVLDALDGPTDTEGADRGE